MTMSDTPADAVAPVEDIGSPVDRSAPDRAAWWARARAEIVGMPDGGLNIAAEALDRHLVDGRGDVEAMRFLRKDGSVERWTYAELTDASARFADALRTLGLLPGDTMALLAGRVPELYVAALGALRAGVVVCPLFSAFGPGPVQQRLRLGRVRAVVTTSSLYRRRIAAARDELTDLEHVILVDSDQHEDGRWSFHALQRDATPVAPAATTAESPALLHFTSGTTGAPKGAVHVHEAVVAHRATGREVFDLGPDDVYWCTADPGWVTGTSYGIVAPLTCGVTMVIDEAEIDPERWYATIERERVTVWYTAPTAIRMLRRAGDELPARFDLSSLRLVASVGEPLDAESVVWGGEVLGRLIHDTWWQTETGAIMVANVDDADLRPGSMGRPLPGVEVALLETDVDGDPVHDADGRCVVIAEPERPGMIALRPGWPSMFRTYLGAPERYAASFDDGWYLTGDLAQRDADGRYWFMSRADDVIKTAGHLIGPFEVERVLNEHPAVVGAGVYGVPDAVAGQLVHASIVLRDGVEDEEATVIDVMAHARRALGATVAPRSLQVIHELPVTRSGKILRRLLRARELGLDEGDTSTLERPEPAPGAEPTEEGDTR